MTFAALALVSCGGEDEIKLDDQNGFHQAIKYGGEQGSALKAAKSYDEFKEGRTTIEKYQKAFKEQLGGESYLAYLKCVRSAIDGIVLTEVNIDQDKDINYIRDFYKTNIAGGDDNSHAKHPAAELGASLLRQLNSAKDKREFDAIRAKIEAKERELYVGGDMTAYSEFVGSMINDLVAY